jgi:lipoate-protein ligase A
MDLALISRQHDDIISAQRKFSLRDHDYVIDDRKIGGNAQTITKERFVHHTSFLWNYDAKKMGYLKVFIFC